MNDEELTAYCGLFCADCIRYKSKACGLAAQLLDELSGVNFEAYAKIKQVSLKELVYYDQAISALKAIIKLNCQIPCRVGDSDCTQNCQIVKCVRAKDMAGCWECDGFEACDKFEFVERMHGDSAKNNQRIIRKYGLDKWAIHREKCYRWQ